MVKVDSPLYPRISVICSDCNNKKHPNKPHQFWYDVKNKHTPTACQCPKCEYKSGMVWNRE